MKVVVLTTFVPQIASQESARAYNVQTHKFVRSRETENSVQDLDATRALCPLPSERVFRKHHCSNIKIKERMTYALVS